MLLHNPPDNSSNSFGQGLRRVPIKVWGYLALSLGLLLLLVGGMWWQSQWLSLSQDARSQADASPPFMFTVSDLPSQVEAGQPVYLDLFLNTHQTAITGFQLAGAISGLADTPHTVEFQTIDVDGLSPVLQRVRVEQMVHEFDLINLAEPMPPYQYSTNGQAVRVGRLMIRLQQTATFQLEFYPDQSLVSAQTAPVGRSQYPDQRLYTVEVVQPVADAGDSESSSAGDRSDDEADQDDDSDKNSCNESCDRDGDCKSQYECYEGRCRSPEEPEDDECLPDRGLNRACNEYCADDRECADGFTCYYNFCRLPDNIENDRCQLPPTPSPTTFTASGPGFDQTSDTGVGGTQASQTPTPRVSPSPSPRMSPTPVATSSADLDAAATTAPPTSSPVAAQPRVIEPTFEPIPADVQDDLADQQRGPSLLTRIFQIILILGVASVVTVGVIWFIQSRE